MRIKLTLSSTANPAIPINYQHFLSSAIYNYLAISDKNFSSELHDGKNFKYFTFSWLHFPQKKILKSFIKIISPEFYWYISSPWDKFVQNFVNGLLEKGELQLATHQFPIIKTETLPPPSIRDAENIKFTCLSPLVVTTKKEYQGKLTKYYYKPTDNPDEISEKIRQNLIHKYESYYTRPPADSSLKITFNEKYLKSFRKAQVLSHYIKNDLDIKIPAIMCPFTASGSGELINFGYECGFGELNSAGFGMVREIKKV